MSKYRHEPSALFFIIMWLLCFGCGLLLGTVGLFIYSITQLGVL